MVAMTEPATERRALATCAGLPGAELSHPFGPETPVFKVGGKVFAVLSPDRNPPLITVKCEPEAAEALVRQHLWVIPGYHMDKRHWISIHLAADTPASLLKDLIVDSYDLVVHTLPVSRRPLT